MAAADIHYKRKPGGGAESAPIPKHYHLKLDFGLPTERIVSFATQAERLAAAKAALRAERDAA